MRKRNHTVTIRMNKRIRFVSEQVKRIRKNTAGSCDKSNRRLEDSIGRGNRRTEKTEPDVCGYPLSLRGATTNINQIARKLHTDGEIPATVCCISSIKISSSIGRRVKGYGS